MNARTLLGSAWVEENNFEKTGGVEHEIVIMGSFEDMEMR